MNFMTFDASRIRTCSLSFFRSHSLWRRDGRKSGGKYIHEYLGLMIRKFDAVKVKIAFSFQHTLDVCAGRRAEEMRTMKMEARNRFKFNKVWSTEKRNPDRAYRRKKARFTRSSVGVMNWRYFDASPSSRRRKNKLTISSDFCSEPLQTDKQPERAEKNSFVSVQEFFSFIYSISLPPPPPTTRRPLRRNSYEKRLSNKENVVERGREECELLLVLSL